MEGTPFGRYRLIELLGRGGMGEVWRAHDTVTERVVALKVLPAQYADDPVFQERFRREARSAAGLDEPHVVPIHDFGEIDGRLFVTMRLIKGRDLHDILSDGPIDAARAVGIIDQVGEALHSAHEVGLIHRDVKPSNILVSDNDFAYLIDFGIARAAGQASLTSTGTTIGTWAYMAPERLSKDHIDARADVYALACVLHECLTGQQPFLANSLERHIAAHLTEPPPRPSALQPTVPASFDVVIAKGMAKNPDQRYATTRELALAARSAVTAPMTRRPEPVPPPTFTASRHTVVANYPVPPSSGPSSTDATQHRSMPYGSVGSQNPSTLPPTQQATPARAGGSRGTKIALALAICAIALVVASAIAISAISAEDIHGSSGSLSTSSSSSSTSLTSWSPSSSELSPPVPPVPPLPTMSGHYIRTSTNSSGQSSDSDWYFTSCGAGCVSIARALNEQAFGQARLANGQWTLDYDDGVAVCPNGSKVSNANIVHNVWDPYTLAGTAKITEKFAVCGESSPQSYTNKLQFRQVA